MADDYERGRPGYPRAAVDWLLPARGQRVVDVGAGTGKLSAVLVAAGQRVIAVEPDARMLARLRRTVPQASARRGAAEELPVPDASAEAVVAGQAFHWFDTTRALPEMARVLVPGGIVGLIWNLRDTDVPWLAELSLLLGSRARELIDDDGLAELFAADARFTPLERAVFPHAETVDLRALLAAVRSRSAVAMLGRQERERLLTEIAALWQTHPDLRGHEQVQMSYRTTVLRLSRR